MTRKILQGVSRRQALAMGGAAGVLAAAGLPRGAFAQDKPEGLPDTMIWSTYDVGSTGYVEATAIADAMIKAYGTRIRLLPSGSGIGRILPLKNGQANTAWLANELFFATRGLYEFADKAWGPQDMRVVMGRPSTFGLLATKESGIKSIADVKGKRVAYAAANPSVSIKNDTLLAAAGLTHDDIEVIEFPSYADSLRALINGQADVTGASTTSAVLYELEASPRGIVWLPIDPEDEAVWEGMNKVAPIFAPTKETVGAGISEENPVQLAAYRYPMVTVYADADPAMTYGILKGIDETFPGYKDAAPIMKNWNIDLSGTPPMDAPFHEGAIRYLKEKGMWGEKEQAWNDKNVEEIQALIAAWKELMGQNLSDEEFADAWAEKRAQVRAG